ncbi:MAG: PDZ domain-containing protein, partial [Chitinophagaceae bacterium]
DQQKKILYVYPPTGMNMRKQQFEVSRLNELIVIKDSKNINISGIRFTGTNRTFMLTKEPLLRSDWTIFRGGAILLDKTENISISDNQFSNLGGNAIFVSNYNRHANITGNVIENIGGSAIAFVGNPDAVRSPAFNYNQNINWNQMDYRSGPKSPNYPANCTASNNLIHDIGTIEKQVAGIEISMSSEIVVSHNTIYNVPRAGINIGDGCWGGHIIEFNDVFNTVLETGDHGAFNSWGRDRFWRSDRKQIDSIVAAKPGIELLDVIKPITLRHNRFRCDHGWDIDLDDGSSNYQIYNNVCLSGGLKLREGYHRTVTNNIIINNTFHPHVWLKNSDDVFSHNIVTSAYAPIQINDWGRQVDSNFFLSEAGLKKAQALKIDLNSSWGDAMFVDAVTGNFRLKENSPALKAGFKNIPMDFGVSSVKLAAKPKITPLITQSVLAKNKSITWLGATFKNVEMPGEQSAAGLSDLNGALVVVVPRGSVAAKNQLIEGDVIIMLNGEKINSIDGLMKSYQANKWKGAVDCVIFRNQGEKKVRISFKN